MIDINNVRREFSDRVEEIETYFRLLENLEKGAKLFFPEDNRQEKFEFGLIGTLKSSAILLLYNLIEFSVSRCIEKIHQTVTDEKLTYDLVSINIQKIWLSQFYEKFKETSSKNEYVLANLKLMVDTLLRNNVPVRLIYRDKEKRSSEISGNLDAKKIREIAEKYGLDFQESSEALKKIKEKRIDLAHGIESFLECCKVTSVHDLRELKDKSVCFIDIFINAVEEYIKSEKYKADP
jgi:hypothetical protein